MGLATTKIVFRKDKMNDEGIAPICIRIIKNRKVSYVTTGIRIKEKFWDETNHKVRVGYPNSARVNQIILKAQSDVSKKVLEVESNDSTATITKIKEELFGTNDIDFFQVSEELIQSYRNKGNIGTADKNNSIINKFKKFTGKTKFPFAAITPRLLNFYQQYCFEDLNNVQNTVAKDLRFIRTVFNYAIRQGIINESLFPFKNVPIKTEPTKGTFLTTDELKLIEDYSSDSNHLMKIKELSLFQYYSGGIRISDLIVLKWKQIAEDRINIQIRKTGVQMSNKLNYKALDILNGLANEDERNPEHFVFSFLPNNLQLNNYIELDRKISSITAVVNKGLKKIAEDCGIDKPLSTHIFRHTFATQALKKGISLEHVKEILKHSNIRETQIYAKILNEDVDKSLDKLVN